MRVYGPVPSRRFGLSLGVDLVPHKTCTFDCIYCQLGPTDCLSSTPKEHYEVDVVLADVARALEDGPMPDVVTLAGSGEPTLFRPLDSLIRGLREITEIPLLLITNGSLLWREDVAEAAMGVDILAPSLDAGDPETFLRVNRPHEEISFDRVVRGLSNATRAFGGEIRLEVMLVDGVNDGEGTVASIAEILGDLRFDIIEVNTPVRPPLPERGAVPCGEDALGRALEAFGPKARAIGAFRSGHTSRTSRTFDDRDKDVREMLLRRPCTARDVSESLGMHRHEASKTLGRLVDAGLVEAVPGSGEVYFRCKGKNPSITNP